MTQHERALNGLLFDAHSKELIDLKHNAHTICHKFNLMEEGDKNRQPLIKEFIGKIGRNYYFMGPIQFNYGVNTQIGDNFFANFNFTVLDDSKVTIGDNVMIGPNVSIMAASHPLLYNERENIEYLDGHTGMAEYSKGITIGDHVWIGCGVIICDGVKIGNGVVIGAGSVVTHNIPDNYLAYGNPCRLIREISGNDSKMSLLQ